MVAHYKQFLPMLANFIRDHRRNLSTAIEETLQVMEKHGGADAFRVIKTYVPTYQTGLSPV